MNHLVLRRFGALLATAGLLGSLLAVTAAPVAAAPPIDANCPVAITDDETATECRVTGPHGPLTGTFNFHKTLHIESGGSIIVTPNSAIGITLNVDNVGFPASAGDVLMDSNAALISADDTGLTTNEASPITINVAGQMVMQAGSRITARNTNAGGDGGVVTIDVNGARLLMCGSSGATDLVACAGAHATLAGAQILTGHSGGAGDTGVGGNINITVGPDATHGKLLMGGGTLTLGAGSGALISSGSVLEVSTGSAGNIAIYAGEQIIQEAGAQILAEGTTTLGHGGRIFLDSSCGIDVLGKISSRGQDPGADLVHLGSCEVHIFSTGLVQSTGPAHTPSTPSSCDNVNDPLLIGGKTQPGGDAGEVLRDHPENSGTCVEIWARHVIIDGADANGTGGQVHADFATGGDIQGFGWVDVFAEQDIIITGPPAGTPGDTTGTSLKYAVHANGAFDQSDDTGGDVTVKAQNAFITMTGQALQANALANGGNGGAIIVEAKELVNLDTALLQARGDNFGGGSGNPPPCDSGDGACGEGGTIDVRSFQNAITWQNGVGDVNPDRPPAPPAGSISLTACTTVTTTGTNFDDAVPVVLQGAANCAVGPTFPSYVSFNPNNNWNTCGTSSISGVKFQDLDADGVKDVGELGLSGWRIHIFSGLFHAFQDTGVGGAYSFTGLAAGTYTVCEQLIVAVPPWVQTFPTALTPGATDCSVAVDPAGDNPTPGKWGWSVTVGNGGLCCSGTTVVDKDFGNIQLATKTGIKWLDVDGDHTRDLPQDLSLDGWVIHLYGTAVNGTAVHETATTTGGGIYTFNVLPGTYTVCEQMPVASPPWVQTFPTAGANCVTPADPAGDNPNPGPLGYAITLTSGQIDDGNDFGNTRQQDVCQKPTAIAIMNEAFPGNGGADITVHTDAGQSVQAAVDSATDLNGDKYVIIFVIGKADNSLGGSANQKVVISKDYTASPASNFPFGVIGCSVTLTGGGTGPAVWIKDTAKGAQWNLNGRPTNILVADLHGGNSAVGVQADGTLRYLRNEAATGNVIGIQVNGSNNTVHNGAANGNTSDGVQINGNNNYVTDTNSMSNKGNGFKVVGASNQLLKLDAGEKSTPNTLDGVRVEGASNKLSEIDAYKNGNWGINVIGNLNQLLKNVAGASGKGNGFGGATFGGIRVAGLNTQLSENQANYNTGLGFSISAGSVGNTNKLLKNTTNTNSGNEFVIGANNQDQGGNKRNGTAFTFMAAAVNVN